MSDEAERRRNATLNGYGLLDTPNEAEFDAIVWQAAKALGVKIALISLVDEQRQWFKAKLGLSPSETPRSISFCTHAIRGREVFTVEDATQDARFAANPLVTGDPNIRFYCGVPLEAPNGARVGTLCVIDDKPRPQPSDDQKTKLVQLAKLTMQAFERRKRRHGLR